MRIILTLQAIYYMTTGIWPLVHLPSFELVTGPKTDDWLVQTVGVLATVIGASLFVGSRRNPPNRETLVLSVLSAIGFAAVDTIFVILGVISGVYLADTAVQTVILIALAVSAFRARDL